MKKILLTLNVIILFSSLNSLEASANNISQFNLIDLSPRVYFNKTLDSISSSNVWVKSGGPYNEAEDPLFRKGTKNTDSPQGMFFAIPFALTAIFFIALFLRKK